MILPTWVRALQQHAPDADRWLAAAFKGTGLLQGGASDMFLTAAIACAFPLGRWVLDRHLWEPVGRRLLGLPGDPKKTDERPSQEQLRNLDRFKESAYKCGVQVTLILVLLLVSLNKPWFYDTRLFWADCDRLPCNNPISVGERFVYCLTLGFYTQAVPMLFLWETRRRDWPEVLAHHLATVLLIAYSYHLNLTRVGVMVLVCHESNDIFLEAAKMARYVNARESLTTGLFVVFMLSWFATRVFAFPAFVIRSTLFESAERAREVGGVSIEPHYTILNSFLAFLYSLHLYWSYLILRIAVKQLTTGGAEDIREEEESSSSSTGEVAAAQHRRQQQKQGQEQEQEGPMAAWPASSHKGESS